MKFKSISNNELSKDMIMNKESFEEYMNYFKKQPLSEKQGIILDQLESLSSLTNMMCEDIDAENKPITEYKKLNDDYSEDEFAESVITLVNMIQNSICNFDLKLYDSENDEQ